MKNSDLDLLIDEFNQNKYSNSSIKLSLSPTCDYVAKILPQALDFGWKNDLGEIKWHYFFLIKEKKEDNHYSGIVLDMVNDLHIYTKPEVKRPLTHELNTTIFPYLSSFRNVQELTFFNEDEEEKYLSGLKDFKKTGYLKVRIKLPKNIHFNRKFTQDEFDFFNSKIKIIRECSSKIELFSRGRYFVHKMNMRDFIEEDEYNYLSPQEQSLCKPETFKKFANCFNYMKQLEGFCLKMLRVIYGVRGTEKLYRKAVHNEYDFNSFGKLANTLTKRPAPVLNYKKEPFFLELKILICEHKNEEFEKINSEKSIYHYYDELFNVAMETKNFQAMKLMLDSDKLRLKDDKHHTRREKLMNRLNTFVANKCNQGDLETVKAFMLEPQLKSYINMYYYKRNYLDAALDTLESNNPHIVEFLLNSPLLEENFDPHHDDCHAFRMALSPFSSKYKERGHEAAQRADRILDSFFDDGNIAPSESFLKELKNDDESIFNYLSSVLLKRKLSQELESKDKSLKMKI